jgi:predicted small integral membrane protein
MSSGAADESVDSYLFAAINEVRVSFRHAETIVQARFYNYLMAVSILILAWAAFATSDPWSNFLRGVVAMLGLILSVLWSILGSRQRKFLALHMASKRGV